MKTVASSAISNLIQSLNMAKTVSLIIPDKSKHKYVVGIDFGHGETSAAICEIEWDKNAGQRLTQVSDIDIDSAARKKVIPSAICRKASGELYIGEEAFEHTTDNDGIRICFKQRPVSIDGKAESLMSDYMKAVYNKIRENDDRLTPSNHIVYIARPSGWTDEEAKDIYRQMALKAGIPLAGLTSESRAAIFYAKSPHVNFANEIDRGAIVFDLGSSTLDFTYLSDKDNPTDFGYNLGASIIDRAIYENMILRLPQIAEFVEKYPEYEDALLYQARKFKEFAYSRNPESKSLNGFPLGRIISENDASYDEYAGEYVDLRVKNLQELNDLIENSKSYQAKLKEALLDFKNNHIKGKRINGVFLTGGASRMNFIRPLVADVMALSVENVKVDGDNPSLTISRGIALLGVADAISSHLVSELNKKIPSLVDDNKLVGELIDKLSEKLAEAAWQQVKDTCKRWVTNGTTNDEDQLEAWLKKDIKSFQDTKLKGIVEETLQDFFTIQNENIRKELNKIIIIYAPGREISMSGNMSIGDISSINKSIENMSDSISKICNSITNTLATVLWAALGLYLFGIFAVGYYIIKGVVNFFRDDSSIRQDKADKLLEKKDKVITDVRSKLKAELSSNGQFKQSLKKSLSNYFGNLIKTNLSKVVIPIE